MIEVLRSRTGSKVKERTTDHENLTAWLTLGGRSLYREVERRGGVCMRVDRGKDAD